MSDYTKDRWDLNGFNVSEIIVARDGPAPDGKTYRDGRHQISIAHFAKIEDAKRARECVNAMAGIDDPVAFVRDTHDVIETMLGHYVRFSGAGDFEGYPVEEEPLVIKARALLSRIGGGE